MYSKAVFSFIIVLMLASCNNEEIKTDSSSSETSLAAPQSIS